MKLAALIVLLLLSGCGLEAVNDVESFGTLLPLHDTCYGTPPCRPLSDLK